MIIVLMFNHVNCLQAISWKNWILFFLADLLWKKCNHSNNMHFYRNIDLESTKFHSWKRIDIELYNDSVSKWNIQHLHAIKSNSTRFYCIYSYRFCRRADFLFSIHILDCCRCYCIVVSVFSLLFRRLVIYSFLLIRWRVILLSSTCKTHAIPVLYSFCFIFKFQIRKKV